MWDINYDSFFQDCDEVFKDFLADYGFVDAGGDEEEYEKFYKSEHWIIEVNMLCNFPHIGVCRIFKSIENKHVRGVVLEKFLNINFVESSKIYDKHLELDTFKTYKGEMIYVKEKLETFYKPILTGEFTYEDYKKFEGTMGGDVT